jgi:hypothetical protein
MKLLLMKQMNEIPELMQNSHWQTLVIVPKTENEDFLAALTSSLLLGYKGSNN